MCKRDIIKTAGLHTGDTRDKMSFYTQLPCIDHLFEPPAENKRVASFQSYYLAFGKTKMLYHIQDRVLGRVFAVWLFANVYLISMFRGNVQQFFVRKVIIKHHIGLLQYFISLNCK